MLLKQRRPGKVLGECHTQAITAAAAAAFRLVWLRCRRCFYFFAGGQEFFFSSLERVARTKLSLNVHRSCL